MNKLLYTFLIILECMLLCTFQNSLGQKIARHPYLQIGGPTSMTIRYRTDIAINSQIEISTDAKTFNRSIQKNNPTSEHKVLIDSLIPNTRYFYRIKLANTSYVGDSTYFFKTAPKIGTKEKVNIWSIGDMYPGQTQKDVYQGFIKFIGNKYTNLFLTLGDNVYGGGTDSDFQNNFFDVYQNGHLLRQTTLFPSLGNHDYDAYPKNQDQDGMAYYQNFSVPSQGQLGGIPSKSQAYYSYDYANIHFVCLDSYAYGKDNLRIFDGPSEQLKWLKEDLASTKQEWKIVYFHFPPYTKGTYDSDSNAFPNAELPRLRAILAPIFDEFDVDMVLSGHSHVFERSRPLTGLYGSSAQFDKKINWTQTTSGKYDKSDNSCPFLFQNQTKTKNGVIYVVNGVGGATGNSKPDFPHPVMEYSLANAGGSFYIEIEAGRLDAKVIDVSGKVLDQFTVMKGFKPRDPMTQTINYADKIDLNASWIGDYIWSTGEKTQNLKVSPTVKSTFSVSDPQGCFQENFTINVNAPLGIEKVQEEYNEKFDRLTIYDFSGKKIKEFSEKGIFTKQLISELSFGIYIVHIEQNGLEKTIKIAVNSF